MTTATSCRACGTGLRSNARFCDSCGASIAAAPKPAEYKQVTVLFADVVHSMDIATAVGAERLREIMTALVNRCASVVAHYGGTLDKFTGDGIMAVFGAPAALENHAFLASLAALEVQNETQRLAVEVKGRDDVDLQLRVGLNSGQVIAGEIGSGAIGYTAIGEQVGMAQRMESIARPGAVMLSESTARLVEDAAVLGEPERVLIKGSGDPVPARRLLAIAPQHARVGREASALVGRQWELGALTGILDRSVDGHGCVVGVVGPPGIGKSRLVRELAATAATRGVDEFSAFCEVHTREIPFHAVTGLLRAAIGVTELNSPAAREWIRAWVPDANPDDLLLLDDLLGIADPDIALPRIDPDARRRRLTALVNAASVAREAPVVYVVEDVHWIDAVSEMMLADFLAVIPQTHSMVVITYRPEYRGVLTHIRDAQTITLAPLGVLHSASLTTALLGSDRSVEHLATTIAERAAGNPFFIEEMVRELAERGVLTGERGSYLCDKDIADISVPPTLQATIGARIDRLYPDAKRTLTAAAVIGSAFDTELLTSLGIDPTFDELLNAEMIDRVTFAPRAEYAFRHPLIRKVAYESQLKSERVRLHKRLAAAIEERVPETPDESAALIAEHLEAAGDLHAAYAWQMRAGTWSVTRDIVATRSSWQRAYMVADRIPVDDPDRIAMRIASLARFCATSFRVSGSVADAGFDELRALCTAADDKVSLAIGMAGQLIELTVHARRPEAAQLASEYVRLLESIGDPALTVGLSYAAIFPMYEAGQIGEALRLTGRAIELADGDPTKGNVIWGSPLALVTAVQGLLECFVGRPHWKDRMDEAIRIVRAIDPPTHVANVMYKYVTIVDGALLPDAAALRDTAEALRIAEESGDNFVLALARLTRGITLVHRSGPERERGGGLLREVGAVTTSAQLLAEVEIANEKARTGDVDGAITMSRTALNRQFETDTMMWRGRATTVLVEALLRRGEAADRQEARAAIDRLAAVPTEPGFVVHKLPLLRLRALLADANADEGSYRDLVERYRAMATSLGFEGHMATAQAMTRW
jgi:adenylate cyclase